MLGNVGKLLVRQNLNQFVRHGSHGGVIGENLPFSLGNRYRFTALFVVFFGSGLGAPFLVLRHQLTK